MDSKDLKVLLCRTCLTTLSNNQPTLEMFHLFNTENLAKMLRLCLSLEVEATDEYPQQVCMECYNKILQFYEFQQMCFKSFKKYKELLDIPGKVKQEYDIDVDNDNDPLNEDIKLNYVLEKEQLIDAFICAEPLENNLLNSPMKRKKGRPPKKNIKDKSDDTKPKRNCRNEKKKESKITKLDVEVVSSRPRNLKPEKETVVKQEIVMSEIKHPTENDSISSNELGAEQIDDPKPKDSNMKKEHFNQVLPEDEMALSDSECDSSNQETKSPPKKRAYKCDRCTESFFVLHRLEAHKRQHDGLPAYPCTIEGCERSFNRWYYYNEHLKDHKGSLELHKCDVDNCERVYKYKSALNIHKRKYHNQGPALKSHMCEICGKVFKSSAVLNNHRYTHKDRTQLPYACDEPNCTKRFVKKEKLKIHKMRHAGIKNFICPHCGMRKTTRNELTIHMNYHTLERTWPCRFCSRVCNSAGNLKTHVKNMHEGAKDFACQYCERTFAKADTKKHHEMTHTGEKPHECKECGKRFVQPVALRTHRKIHLKQKAKNIKEGNQKAGDYNIPQNSKDVESMLRTEAMLSNIYSDNDTNLVDN